MCITFKWKVRVLGWKASKHLYLRGENEAQEKSASVELIIKRSDVNSKQFFPYIQQDAYFFKENFKTR